MSADDDPPLLSKDARRAGLALGFLLVVLTTLFQSSGLTVWGAPEPPATTGEPVSSTPTPSATLVPATPTLTASPTPTVTLTPTPTMTASPTLPPAYRDWARENYGPPWPVDCTNEPFWDGFDQGDWALHFCVPGQITDSAYYFDSPTDHFGLLSSYAPGVMEAQVRHRGLPEGTRGVALMSCNEIGQKVWLRPEGQGWDGPFVVVDCSQKNHLYYHMIGMGLAAEVGAETAGKWGFARANRVDVHLGGSKPGDWNGVYLAYWWVENALEFERQDLWPTRAPKDD